LTVTLLLGAILVTGIAISLPGLSKDFMSVLGWGMLIFIIAMLPAFMAAFPGLVTDWVKIIPSYFLVDTVHRAVNYGSGWETCGLTC
jgi:ABC-2 type transport system permease protein